MTRLVPVVWLALLVVVTRLPFGFTYEIDWDESTFILLSSSLLKGHLPYTDLLDIKGPVGIALMASFLRVFGESVPIVRLCGAVCILVASVQTAALGRRLVSPVVGLLAGSLFIVGAAATFAGQATMMEYLALPLLLGAAMLVLRREASSSHLFFAGMLMCGAAFVRMNLGIVAVGLGVLVGVQYASAGVRRAVSRVAVYAAGGGLALLLVALPYLVLGKARVFLEGAFLLPLVHAGGNLGLASAAFEVLRNVAGVKSGVELWRPELWLALLVWFPAFLTVLVMIGRPLRAAVRLSMASHGELLALLLVTLLSIVMSGIPWPHHLLQALPFACLFAAVGIMALLRLRHVWIAWGVIGICLAGALQNVAREYPPFIRRVTTGTVMTGRAGQIAAFIGSRCAAPCKTFMVSDHIVYWLLKAPLPTRVVQPSNLFTPGYYFHMPGVAASPALEVQRILDSKPEFIVAPSLAFAHSAGVTTLLNTRYALVARIEDRQIYRLQQ